MGSTSQIGGLVSGLDTASIISQLMQLEAMPQTMLKNRVAAQKTQVTSLQTINAKIAAIATKATQLAKQSNWFPSKASSDNPGVTVTAAPNVTPASLSLGVGSTAKAATATFSITATLSTAVAANTTLTLHFDDSTHSDITVDTGDGKLQTIADALNAKGVKATLVKAGVDSTGAATYRMSIEGPYTGAGSGFSVSSPSGRFLGGVQTSTQYLADTSSSATAATSTAAGTFQITSSSGTYAFSVTAGDSLDAIASTINNAGSGVKASVVPAGSAYRLELSTADGSAFSVAPTGTTTAPLLGGAIQDHSVGGQDASITVNGATITSSTNTFTGLMPGVDVTLAANASTTANITVGRDTQSLSDQVKSMVDAVNSALDDISSLTGYDAGTKTSGLLAGDSTLRTVRDRLLDSVTTGIDGSSLAAVGIEVDKTGKLTFDETKFQDAYNADPTGTAEKFAARITGAPTGVTLQGSTWRTQPGAHTFTVDSVKGVFQIDGSNVTVAGSLYTGAMNTAADGLTLSITGDMSGSVTYVQGIAAKLEAIAQRASNSVDGSITSEIQSDNSEIDSMNTSISDWDVRLQAKQDQLQQQYAALEVALGKMQNQASWLSGQIASLPSTGSGG
ncbi:MAG: flagellar filament capping protein FliD [Nocardioidaceae bacterium]